MEAWASSTLKEGDFSRSDNVDDHRLGQNGFNEPSRMKQVFIIGFQAWQDIGAGILETLEEKEHQEIRGIIENGADGTNKEHEFFDIANVPFAWGLCKFWINFVCRDANLRNIV